MFFTIVFPSLCAAEEGALEGKETYAILVQGSKESWTANNLKLVYSTLIKRGVPRENIMVVSPLVFLALKADNFGEPDLDGDGRWDVTFGPTFNHVKEAFRRLGEKVKDNPYARIFLYFTMHGLPRSLLLESITGEKKDIESVELKEWIRKNFSKSQEVILFIDACYSASFREILSDHRRDYLFFASAEESRKSYFNHLKNGELYTENEVLDSFSRIGKTLDGSKPTDEWKFYGIFTYHFFSALNGSYPEGSLIPQADFDGNGVVSLEEAYRYADDQPLAGLCVGFCQFDITCCSQPVFERFQIEELAPSPRMEPLYPSFDD